MTAKDLLRDQMEDAGYQLNACLEGLPDFAMDHKATPDAMSPREMLAHLAEVYLAVCTDLDGRKHAWGSWHPADMDWGPLIAEFRAKRVAAVAKVLASEDPKAPSVATAYIVGHDYYHVGQLVLTRLATTPDWDSYSIYRP